MIFEQQFRAGIQDVGKGNEITNKAILEMFTNTTNLHGNHVGQGVAHLEETPLAWVVLNWKAEVLKRPKVCESMTVRTWAQEYSKVHADRDFEIAAEDGSVAVRGTSRWVAVDLGTGRMKKLDEVIMGPYGCEPDHKNFPDFKFSKMNEKDVEILGSTEFKIIRSMIDVNGHVYNPMYLDIAREVFPDELEDTLFNDIEVSYKNEIKPRETVTVEYGTSAEQPGKYLVRINDSDGRLHSGMIFGRE